MWIGGRARGDLDATGRMPKPLELSRGAASSSRRRECVRGRASTAPRCRRWAALSLNWAQFASVMKFAPASLKEAPIGSVPSLGA